MSSCELKVLYNGETTLLTFDVAFEDLQRWQIQQTIFERTGIAPSRQTLTYAGLFDDDEEVPDRIDDALLESGDTVKLANVEGISSIDDYFMPTIAFVDETAIAGEKLIALTPPEEFEVLLDGRRTTIAALASNLLCDSRGYSQVVTCARGKVGSPTSRMFNVYPFVFRVGGKDAIANWATSLQERLAGSIHPVSVGPTVYADALKALDSSNTGRSDQEEGKQQWSLVLSLSFRYQS